jgi:hypothetical protein
MYSESRAITASDTNNGRSLLVLDNTQHLPVTLNPPVHDPFIEGTRKYRILPPE